MKIKEANERNAFEQYYYDLGYAEGLYLGRLSSKLDEILLKEIKMESIEKMVVFRRVYELLESGFDSHGILYKLTEQELL